MILLSLFFKRSFYSSCTEIFPYDPGTSELLVSKELSKLFVFLCDRMTLPDELTCNGEKRWGRGQKIWKMELNLEE